MIKQRKIELLAPAKNLECGIEAINHGVHPGREGPPGGGEPGPVYFGLCRRQPPGGGAPACPERQAVSPPCL